MAKIKILPLGGQDERGKNCYLIQVNKTAFIFDAGIKVPVNEQLGISMVTPDYDYLGTISANIKGIFIGYCTSNNYAGLPFLLQKINSNTPVYCSNLGKIIIETYFEKKVNNRFEKPKIKVVEPLKKIEFDDATIIPIKISNSIPQSLGWIIKTEDGSIIYLDEYIINNDKSMIFDSNINKINIITKGNNLALLPSLGNVGNNRSYTTPNHNNFEFYDSIIRDTKGRVFIACNDRDAFTILNVAQIARKRKRPFCIYSNTFMNFFSGVVKNKLINTRGLNCVQISSIESIPNCVVIISSTQDNLFKLLFTIINEQKNSIHFNSTDTFILGTQLVPGYEGHGARIMNELSRNDIRCYSLPRTILPMNASNEDHKYLVDLLLPKYVFPIQGFYKSVVKFEQVISQSQIKLDQVVYLDNGEGVNINDGEIQSKKWNVKLNENYIGNVGLVDVGATVLAERRLMADSGIIFIIVAFDKKNKSLIKYFKYDSFGVTTDDENSKILLDNVIEEFKNNIVNYLVFDSKTKKLDSKKTKILFKKAFAKLFEKKFFKRPIVLPSIIEVME